MKTILHTTLIQTTLHWENVAANLAHFSQKIASITTPTNLIILPEMFTTSFSMNAKNLAEDMSGMTMRWLTDTAAKYDTAIGGSFIATENGNYYNRFVFMKPDGMYDIYDKRHLFTLAKEDRVYTAGSQKRIISYRGWKICPLVCYDLRFPVWSRNQEDYDLLLYVANFPQKRIHAWKSLLVARAIENQAYTVGVNRIGVDGNKAQYNGGSMVVDYNGEVVYDAADNDAVYSVRLDYLRQANFRDRFGFLADRDTFEIKR